MILACHGISKSFEEKVIVNNGSFHIEDHEKVALVGPNGAGKSTILKMIVGELPTDSGNVILTKGKTLGYLAHPSLGVSTIIFGSLFRFGTATVSINAGFFCFLKT